LINKVNLRRARLLLRWATMSEFNSQCRTLILECNQPATRGQLSLPSLWGRLMSTSFGWEGKGRYGSFHQRMTTGCASKTVRSLKMHAIFECLRGVFTTRHYTNPRLPLPLNYKITQSNEVHLLKAYKTE